MNDVGPGPQNSATADLVDAAHSFPAGLYILDSEWRCTFVNAVAAAHFDRKPEELLNVEMWQAFPMRGSPIGNHLERVMETRKPAVFEAPSVVRLGRTVEIHASPIPSGGVACLFLDVTDRKFAERELRDNQAMLKLVLDSVATGCCAVNRDGIVTMVNRAALSHLGLDAADAVNQPVGRVLQCLENPARLQSAIERCCAEGVRVSACDDVFQRGAGRSFPVEYWIEPILLGGAIVGAICNFVDITARKQNEAAERHFKEELQAQVQDRTAERDRMWQLSMDMMSVSDFEGRIVAINPAFTEILGWTPEDVVGTAGVTYVHPDDLQRTLRTREKVRAGEVVEKYEVRLRCKDGSFKVIAFSAVPHERSVYAVGRDMTLEREAERKLKETESALRQTQKMDAIGQLTGGVAHDFNNMLAIIIGNLDLAGRRLSSSDTGVARYLQDARSGAQRAAALTQRLLAFSRQQPLAPQLLDVDRLVRDLSQLLRRSLGETTELEIVSSGGLWPTFVDPHQLEAAIVNLAVNARDAMPNGGKLTIETANSFLDDAYVATEIGVPAGQYVLIAISDAGCGIPPDLLPKVFDPFFTTKSPGQGTGLGLSMVYGFVKQSHGHVKIYSEVGRGTVVKIYLPRYSGPLRDLYQRDAGQSPIAASGRGEAIMVVEDDEQVRQMSVRALEDLGYSVFSASGGAEALKLAENLPRIDLLFTDVVMTGMSGKELAIAFRAIRPELKVLYTTGYTRNAVVHSGILDDGVAFLSKPFSINDLAEKVRAVLNG